MPRRNEEIYNAAYNDFKRGIAAAEIASKYGLNKNTVYGWFRKWRSNSNKKSVISARGLRHNLYSRYLTPETLKAAAELRGVSPLDIQWMMISLKFVAIMTSWQAMIEFIRQGDTEVTTTDKTVSTDGTGRRMVTVSTHTEKILVFDKWQSFLNVQARAMATLSHMLRLYEDMLPESPENEERIARIDKMRAEIQNIKQLGSTDGKPDLAGYINALQAGTAEVWNNGND